MRATTDIPFARMAASNLASVSPCPKLLRTVIKPSTFTCSAPALGQPENDGDDRQPDQHTNQESTRHVVTYACGIHEVTRLSHFNGERGIPRMGPGNGWSVGSCIAKRAALHFAIRSAIRP